MLRSSITLIILILCLVAFSFPVSAYTDLTVSGAQELIRTEPELIILDVREYDNEYCDRGHIPGALNYPYASRYLQNHYNDFLTTDKILVVCQSGLRSGPAAVFLDSKEFTDVYNMTDGMSSWDGETESCGSICPAETLLGNNQAGLRILRTFRDEILGKSAEGKMITEIYYYSSPAINNILESNPRLKTAAAKTLERLLPLIKLFTKQP